MRFCTDRNAYQCLDLKPEMQNACINLIARYLPSCHVPLITTPPGPLYAPHRLKAMTRCTELFIFLSSGKYPLCGSRNCPSVVSFIQSGTAIALPNNACQLGRKFDKTNIPISRSLTNDSKRVTSNKQCLVMNRSVEDETCDSLDMCCRQQDQVPYIVHRIDTNY